MDRIVWTCWFQGRTGAPKIVERCFRSWERRNPGWDIRILDDDTIDRYVSLGEFADLRGRTVTAAARSDILRIALLEKYGGIWADATLFCNRPLDEWLPPLMTDGFFAFEKRVKRKPPISSWFIAAELRDPLVTRWARRTQAYWAEHLEADEYLWFHNQFWELCKTDPDAAARWARVPKVDAKGPHSLQFGGRMLSPAAEGRDTIDWRTPVFKLTYRLKVKGRTVPPGSLLDELLEQEAEVG